MQKAVIKLVVSILSLPLSVLGLRFLGSDFFFVTFIIGLILSTLYCMDVGQILRDTERPSRIQRSMGILLGIPQAFFGLICFLIGVAIVLWVIYNTFIERQPLYSGGFLTLGMAPLMIAAGVAWILFAFKRSAPSRTNDDGGNEAN